MNARSDEVIEVKIKYAILFSSHALHNVSAPIHSILVFMQKI